MKRKGKLRNAIALALMLGMGCMGTAEAAINLGDVDGSGVVDMQDIDALEKYLQTGNSRFLASSKNADVNLDNRIDREDLRLLKQRVYYPGDVNGDNLVDDRDAKAARDYMVTERYNYLADFSNDGSVTLQDYVSACNLVEKAKSMIKGDLNNDGKISISDAALIEMYIKGLTKNINRLAADMNNDGRIDSTDKKIITDKFFNVSRYAPDGEVTSLYSPSAHVIVVEGSVWDNDDLNRDIVVQVNAGPNASDSKQFTVPHGSKRFSQKISFPNVSGVQTVNVYALDAGENRKDKLLKSAKINFNTISRYAPDGEITSLYSPSAHEIVVEGSVWDNDDLNRDIVVQVNAGPNASDSKQFTVPRGSKQFSQKMSFPNVSGVQTVNVYALDVGENRKDKLLKSAQIDFKGTSQVEKYVVTTNGATLALRSGPGTNYGIRARMLRGSVVEVYSINNGWAKLSYNGMSGYAYAQNLKRLIIDEKISYPLKDVYVCGNNWGTYYSKKGANHLGIDIKSRSGDDNVYAVADGKVVQAGWNSANGNTITLQHSVNGSTFYTFYAHLASIRVSKGTSVTKGQGIGVVGNSGSSTTGKHLHFAITTQCSAGTWGYGSVNGNVGVKNGYKFYNPHYVIENNRLP